MSFLLLWDARKTDGWLRIRAHHSAPADGDGEKRAGGGAAARDAPERHLDGCAQKTGRRKGMGRPGSHSTSWLVVKRGNTREREENSMKIQHRTHVAHGQLTPARSRNGDA